MKKKGIKLKCSNCGHIWIYRGNNPYYAQCSRCMYKVNIKKNKIKKHSKGKVF